MLDQFLQKTADLMAQGERFAVATVVRCLPPTSGKPGDKAIVFADGKLWGWIGGGCAQPVVAKEALKALAEEKPRLVRISPRPDAPEEGIVDYTMTCHSGGSLDIYIEPVLPRLHVVILGRSPIAQSLARLAVVVGYAVSMVVEEEAAVSTHGTPGQAQHPRPAGAGSAFSPETLMGNIKVIETRDYSLETAKVTGQTFIVVSTQGEGDEEALEQALKTDAGYVAFVASKTKAEKVFDYLRSRGIAAEKIKRITAPAGLDIQAKSPEEIAVSILAQIIQLRGQAKETAGQAKSSSDASIPLLNVIQAEARDPVCGMSVNPGKARHKSEYEGAAYYFCCAGCKQAFDREPKRYLAATSALG
ncbi:MAG TPA: XdhC family protein [Candidatus Angelobacter sp.]|jgi:xanthine dehydrogenase accessory factor